MSLMFKRNQPMDIGDWSQDADNISSSAHTQFSCVTQANAQHFSSRFSSRNDPRIVPFRGLSLACP